MLQRLAINWHAPISAAVLVDNKSASVWYDSSMAAVQSSLVKFRHVRVTLVENLGYNCPPRYPFNLLRNIALRRCTEPRVMIIDVDFVPHPANKALPSTLAEVGLELKEVLVLPAFDFPARATQSTPSQFATIDKPALRRLVAQGKLLTFGDPQGSRDPWPLGHACTLTNKWLSHSSTYRIRHCNPWYEPYVVLHRIAAPSFDERFQGRGFDKISFIYELFARNMTFKVATNSFVVHYPHAPAVDHKCSKEVIEAAARRAGARDQEETEAFSYNPGQACVPSFMERLRLDHGYMPHDQGHPEFRKRGSGIPKHLQCEALRQAPIQPRTVPLSEVFEPIERS